MIIAYDIDGKEIGRYDTPSDLWYDYPEAEVVGRKAIVKEQPSGCLLFLFLTAIIDGYGKPAP